MLHYQALVLVLLRRSANNINLRGAEAEHVVNRDVLHGAVSRDDLNVTLGRGNNRAEMCERQEQHRKGGAAEESRLDVCPPPGTYLLDEVLEKDGLLPERVVHQALREEDHPVGEVVLREP